MKKVFLLSLSTLVILFVDAQSQIIKGTLLPKKGESVTYSPITSEARKLEAIKPSTIQDSSLKKAEAKKVLHNGNEKLIVKPKVPTAKTPFIFNLPVVQGLENTQAKPPANAATTLSTEPQVNSTTIKPITAAVSSPKIVVDPTKTNVTSTTIKKVDNEPLKYEEPPTGSASWSAPPSNTAPAKLEPLVYGPPPTSDAYTAPPSNNNTESNKKASLRSPKFKGVYKPALKNPILMSPMSPDEMENGVPKKKETEPTANVVEKPKAIEDLYPPLNYTTPIPAAASNLRSPKIQGAYVASKSNPMILMPVPPEPTNGQQQIGNTFVYQEPPIQSNNNSTNNNAGASRTEQATSQPNIFDDNYRGKPTVASKRIYTKYKNAAPKATATKPVINKPVSTSIKQPVKNNFKKKFLKPVKQSVNSGVSFNGQSFERKISHFVASTC